MLGDEVGLRQAIMKLLDKTTALFDRTVTILAIAGAVCLAAIMFVVDYGVVARLVGYPQKWVIEIGQYLLLYFTFLTATWILRMDGHVRVPIVISRLSLKTQQLLKSITYLISAAICVILVWRSTLITWEYFQSGYEFETQIHMPAGPLVAIIAIGSLFLFIQFLRISHGSFRDWRAPRDQAQKS